MYIHLNYVFIKKYLVRKHSDNQVIIIFGDAMDLRQNS